MYPQISNIGDYCECGGENGEHDPKFRHYAEWIALTYVFSEPISRIKKAEEAFKKKRRKN